MNQEQRITCLVYLLCTLQILGFVFMILAISTKTNSLWLLAAIGGFAGAIRPLAMKKINTLAIVSSICGLGILVLSFLIIVAAVSKV